MSAIQVERYEKEIKTKGLFSYIKAKNDHFRNQSTALMYTIASVWPIFGFSIIANNKPEGFLSVVGSFLLGGLPSALVGAFIFTIVAHFGKEIIFRFFKGYRESYNNLIIEKQNFISLFRDLKNQKIILDFIEWKRKYHLAPVVFHDHQNKTNVDFEKSLVSALANKQYSFAADLFVLYNERIEYANESGQNKIVKYREKLDSLILEDLDLDDDNEMEMEMSFMPQKKNLRDML